MRLALRALCMLAAVACGAPQERSRRPASIRTDSVAHADSAPARGRCEEVDESNQCTIWGPSLVELIARPEVYDGKRVRVIGFVNFEFEGNALYLSRIDWEQSVFRNGLWIDAPEGFASDSAPSRKQPNQRYVLVEGTFNADHAGHFGMWSGAIEHVTRLDAGGRVVAPKLQQFKAP